MMKNRAVLNKRGVTLIELMVVFVISGVVIAGIYRVFTSQSRAYVVQDQVTEVQQSIRGAMDILVRDLRIAGYDSDSINSKIKITDSITVGDHSVTLNYEYDNTTRYTVTYRRDPAVSRLMRQLTTTKDNGSSTVGAEEALLENVDTFDLLYGVDQDENGRMDDLNENGAIDDGDWLSAANVGTMKVIAARVTLSARPDQTNQDVKKWVSPRTLTTVVNLRNLCLIKLVN